MRPKASGGHGRRVPILKPQQLRARLLFSIALGVAVLVGLLLYGDLRGVAGSLADFRWVYLPAILGLTLFNYVVRFIKWQYYLRLVGIKGLPLGDSLLIFFAGLGMTITPARVGEWLKSYFLRESQGVPMSRTAPIVLAERVTDGLGMVLLSVAGLLLFRQGWVLVLAMAAVGVAVVAAFRSPVLARWGVDLAGRMPLLRRYTSSVARFYESATVILAPRPLAVAVALSFVSWLGEGVALYYVYLGLGAPDDWELVVQGVFIFSIGTLAGVVSLLPGGLGAAEGGIAGLSKVLVGLSKEGAATATLLIRICTLWFGVAIGMVALLALTRRLRNRAAEGQAGEHT